MPDVFAGTAWYYARYRTGYPQTALDRVRQAFACDGRGRLLDLGCGTGQIALALRSDVADVLAVDVSTEMLAEGERLARAAGAANVRWLCLPAEQISPALGRFRLVTIGSAFHWMQRDEVLRRCDAIVEPGGGVAVMGTESSWSSDEPWARVVRSVVQRWLGQERRTLAGVFQAPPERHEAVLARSAFSDVDVSDVRWDRPVDVETIVGELYSTSFANKALLGERAAAFEADVRQSLLALEPSGRFVQRLRTECIIAKRPPNRC